MSRLRPLLRKVAYRSGALSVARRKSRRSLTVVMLHRVIDTADPDFASTDPTYTLSSALFEQLLGFLLDHYEIVGLTEVMAAYEGVKPLPDHSLLITFDDGWADNLRYAAPLLRRRKTSAVVFTVAEAVLSQADAWWQEAVFAAARNGSLSNWIDQPQVRDILNGSAHEQAAPSAIDVVTVLGSIDQEKRDRLLLSLPAAQCSRRMMLKPDELRELTALGIDIALHGYNHVPLTRSPDVADELNSSKCSNQQDVRWDVDRHCSRLSAWAIR